MVNMTAVSYALMVKNLTHGDMSCEELAEVTGLHSETIYAYTRELHKVGAIYIAKYDKDTLGRHTIKVYKLGAGVDAPRSPLTYAQKKARVRAKKAKIQLALVMAGRGAYVQQANGKNLFVRAER